MKTPKLLSLVLFLVFVLLLINIYLTLRMKGHTVDPNDRSTPNDTTFIERVKNKEERARMEAYIQEMQQGQTILKTIVLPSGEIIDFVDLYTQPALRKHKISRDQVQFAPKSIPQLTNRDSSSQMRKDYLTNNMLYEMIGDSCPPGAIPVRRLTMRILTRFETLEDFRHKSHGYIQPPCGGDGGEAAGHEYAHAARTVDNWGAESRLNLWDNYVEQEDEFSLSQMWVVRGSEGDLETLEAGWQVYRDMYGDWEPHLFIYFTPDNYGDGGGYNLSTGDFVQVNNSVYIAGGFTNFSTENGTQYSIKLLIYKDLENGDWWLKYGDTWVGYWPRSLFDANGLHDKGARIDYGGEIVNTKTDGRHTRTDMGSGHWPSEGFGHAAYHRNILYVDTDNYYRNATGLSATRTNSNCYDISLTESSGSWGVYFYFGGSGYNTQCPD